MSLAAIIVVTGAGTRAWGQTAGDLPDATYRATRGVFLPGAARAGDADATAVELNPGQLGTLRAGALALVGNLWRAEAAMPGRGGALFFAAPVWGGSGGGLGVGLQGIAGGGGAAPAHTKFQLAYGVGGRTAGIGASWGHLFGGGVGGTDTFDVGAAWRPASRVAFGFVVEDVARPRLAAASDRLPRRWVGELALRPFATDRMEIGAAATHLGGDSWSALVSRFRLAARLGGGWRVMTDLELAPRRAGALLAGTDFGWDWRATAGIVMDFEHTRLILAARRAFTPAGAGGENWGASLVVHTSTERHPAAISGGYVARFTLEDVDTDREFLTLALRLRAVASDAGVAAVFLKVDEVELGLGRLEELRDLIGEIQRHGKRVIAYLTQPSMKDLYLASACDKVVMHPAGELTFAGMAQSVTFYKGAMDRLGVSVDLVRIAEYKGAMEPYVMTGQSAAVRQNRNDLLDDLYARVLAGIASGRTAARKAASQSARDDRPLDGARLAQLVAVGSFTPAEARDAGLIDAVHDDHVVKDYVREYLGQGQLDIRDPDTAPVRPIRWVRPRVAVVLLDGTISDGSSQGLPLALGGVAGADTLVAALDECQRDRSVRAVVLRVNSPGGSAFSSDVIARAVARLRAAGKPVVASMGDVAASGGYYVSAPTDVIFAEPSTTTGSIGIFGFKIDVSRLLALLSINVEVIRRGAHADQQSPYRPWTTDERAMAERKIRHLYDLFIGTVAQGRKSRGFTPARVDEVGRGHVWTGAQAQRLGLVDEVGGVTAAIDRAALLGGVPRLSDEEPDLEVLPRPSENILQTLVGLASTDDALAPESSAVDLRRRHLTPPLRAALKLAAPYLFGPGEGVEARLPFDLDLR
ncbi:MAG: signal peptide peptidase SppA [Pseudomonadota bacterium]